MHEIFKPSDFSTALTAYNVAVFYLQKLLYHMRWHIKVKSVTVNPILSHFLIQLHFFMQCPATYQRVCNFS